MTTTAKEQPVSAVHAAIGSILTPLRDQRAVLASEEEELKAKLGEVQGGMREIDRILHAAEPKASNGGKKRKTSDEPRVSEATLTAVTEAVKEMPPNFAQHQVIEKLAGQVGESSVKNALATLRAAGLIRRTGQEVIDNRRRYTHVYVPPGEET